MNLALPHPREYLLLRFRESIFKLYDNETLHPGFHKYLDTIINVRNHPPKSEKRKRGETNNIHPSLRTNHHLLSTGIIPKDSSTLPLLAILHKPNSNASPPRIAKVNTDILWGSLLKLMTEVGTPMIQCDISTALLLNNTTLLLATSDSNYSFDAKDALGDLRYYGAGCDSGSGCHDGFVSRGGGADT